jgi:FAD/FMN-containing dehydrogenase
VSTAQDHARRVAAVAAALSTAGGQAHLDKGGVHHVVPLPGDGRFAGRRIDTSALVEILEVDPTGRRCVAEPGATFEAVLAATLPHGLVPAVVPELRGITVGGAVAGCSVESMSWRHGGFHDTCRSYEIVSGRGEVLEVSREADPDLFEAIHGSYGTLGVLTRVELDLVPAGPYVAMTYRHLGSMAELEAALAEVCALDGADDPDRHQLVDAIAFAPDHLVLCLGRFVDRASRPPSDYAGAEIYHRSVRRLATDLLRTEDYLFRYDADCHWLTATVPPLEWRPVRRALGRWLLGSRNLITWSNRLAPLLGRLKRRPEVVCDVFIPQSRLGDFWDWYRTTFDFWPMWIVPYRPPALYPWVGPSVRERWGDEMFIDCAIYGAPNGRSDRDLSAELEEEVFELGGIKTLIGRNHYDEDRFWQVYDREAYEAAKKRLDPDGAFPGVYEKLGRVE